MNFKKIAITLASVASVTMLGLSSVNAEEIPGTTPTEEVATEEIPSLTGTANRITVANTSTALSNSQLLDAIDWVDDNYSKEQLEFYIYDNTYKQTTTCGTYSYKVRATNPDNETAIVMNYIDVLDKKAPTLVGPDTITSGYRMTEAEILALYSQVDETAPGTIRITYSNLVDAIGTYNLTLQAEDAAGNTSTKTVLYIYEDIIKPGAVVTELVVKNSDTPLTQEQLKNAIVWSDNYNSLSELIITPMNDNYQQTTICGKYSYQYKCVDANGNENIVTNYVNVIDGISPVITGPSVLTAGHLLSDSEILSQFKLNDETAIGELTISSNTSKPTQGIYEIIVRGSDAAGNYVDKSINFKFVGLNANCLFADDVVAVAKASAPLAAAELRNIISYKLNITIDDTWTVTYASDYLNNYATAGSYSFNAKVITPEGVEYKTDFTINVYEPVVTVKVKEKNWFMKTLDKIGAFFKRIWKGIKKIGSFFKWIWKKIF